VQNGSTFECRVNTLPFSHFLEMQKNKKVFSKDGTSPYCTVSVKEKETAEVPGSKFQLKDESFLEKAYSLINF
jgi:hypothetical protein